MGVATEFDKLRKRRRLRRAFKRTTWLMILALLAAAGFLVWSVGYYLDAGSRLENYLSSMRPGPGYPVALDDMDVSAIIPMGTDVAVVTGSGNYVYNQNGARLFTSLNNYSNPVTRGAGGKLITYDSMGGQVKVSTKTEQLYEYSTDGKIFAADICETGAFAIAESSKGVLGQVVAYSAKNDEMYRWQTSQGYLYDLHLNTKGTAFAAASVNTPGGQLYSRLHFHHFSAASEVAIVELPDEMVLSMQWTADERLQVITDRKLHIYNQSGAELAVAALPQDVTNFYNSAEGVIYIASGDNRNPDGATITGYDSTLRTMGSWASKHKIFGMQYYDGRLLVLTEGKLYLADRNLNQVKERKTSGDLTAVCGIGNSIYGITGEGLIRQGL